MTPLEVRCGEAIDKDEAAHSAKFACGAGQEFEDQERGIVDRAGDVGEHHEIEMTGTARTEMTLERQAAVLQRGAYRAAKIETPAARTTEPAAETGLPAAAQDRKGVARQVVFQRRITCEGDAFDTPQIRERCVGSVMNTSGSTHSSHSQAGFSARDRSISNNLLQAAGREPSILSVPIIAW